jgi:hypothetical protein
VGLAQTLAQELVLEREQKEEELRHLLLDFDDFDREEVLRRYQRIMEKENCRTSSKQSTRKQDSIIRSSNSKQPLRIRELMDKKPMASSITITALDELHPQPQPAPPPDNRKKSLISPHRQPPPSNNPMKRSSYYQY